MGVAREITEHWMDWVRMQTCQTPPGHFWKSLKEAQADRHGKTPSKHNQNDRNQLFDPDGTPEICLNMIETRNKNGHLTQLQGCNKADWCFQSLHTESYSCCFPCFPTLTVYLFFWCVTHASKQELEWRLQQSSLYGVNHPFCIILLGIWKMDTLEYVMLSHFHP